MTRLRSNGSHVINGARKVSAPHYLPLFRRTTSEQVCTAPASTTEGVVDIRFLDQLMTRTYEDFEAAASILSMKMQTPHLRGGLRPKLVVRRRRDPFGDPLVEVSLRPHSRYRNSLCDEDIPPSQRPWKRAMVSTPLSHRSDFAAAQLRRRSFKDACLHGVLGSLSGEIPTIGKYMTRGTVRRAANMVCTRIQSAY